MSRDERVARVACRQHGLVTRHQARHAGLSDREIAHRLAVGRWVALRRGVFVISGAPSTREQAILAACLAARAAFVSHLSAGWLWGLRLPVPTATHLTTVGASRIRQAGVVHHRRNVLATADLTRCRGIPVTSAARTLVDSSGLVRGEQLGRTVDDALRRKVVALEDLRTCHDRVDTGPGRRATLLMRDVLARRSPGYDPGGSDWELWAKDILVGAGLPAPVQQHRVSVGRRWYEIDLAYPPEMVGLEFDGWDVHGTFTAFHGDRDRTRILVALGWTLLPVTARTRPADLVRQVRATLALSGQFRTASGQN